MTGETPKQPEANPVCHPTYNHNLLQNTNFNFDYTTPSPAKTDLPTEQSFSSGYYSMSDTSGYNSSYTYVYNRD